MSTEALLLVLVFGQTMPSTGKSGMVTATPEEEPGVLVNPGCGWQKLCHGPPRGEIEKMPMVGTYYCRSCWTHFEPAPEQYEDSPAVRVMDACLLSRCPWPR